MAQIVNDLIKAGFELERLVEQNIEDVAGLTPQELALLPCVSRRYDPQSREYQVMRWLPLALVIRAHKKETAGAEP